MLEDSRGDAPSDSAARERIDRELDEQIARRSHDTSERHPVIEGGGADDAEAGGP